MQVLSGTDSPDDVIYSLPVLGVSPLLICLGDSLIRHDDIADRLPFNEYSLKDLRNVELDLLHINIFQLVLQVPLHRVFLGFVAAGGIVPLEQLSDAAEIRAALEVRLDVLDVLFKLDFATDQLTARVLRFENSFDAFNLKGAPPMFNLHLNMVHHVVDECLFLDVLCRFFNIVAHFLNDCRLFHLEAIPDLWVVPQLLVILPYPRKESLAHSKFQSQRAHIGHPDKEVLLVPRKHCQLSVDLARV